MLVEMTELYKSNKDFKEYVDKFCTKHRTVPENAFKCAVVQEVYRSYRLTQRK